jgi:hypothetical protein
LHDYEEAKRYFQEALAIDIQAVAVYPFYIDTLLLNEDYEEADKLIAFALTIKGINKVEIMLKKVLLLEKQVAFKKAFKDLKEIKLIVTNNEHNYQIEEIEKRLKAKKELVNSKKNKKTTGKKNKGKE